VFSTGSSPPETCKIGIGTSLKRILPQIKSKIAWFLNQNLITLLKSNATPKTAATAKKNPTIYNPTTLFIVENIQLTNEKENLC